MSNVQPYNITVTDQSPLFQYAPFRDGPIDAAWNVSYSGTPDASWTPDAVIGSGVSILESFLEVDNLPTLMQSFRRLLTARR